MEQVKWSKSFICHSKKVLYRIYNKLVKGTTIVKGLNYKFNIVIKFKFGFVCKVIFNYRHKMNKLSVTYASSAINSAESKRD